MTQKSVPREPLLKPKLYKLPKGYNMVKYVTDEVRNNRLSNVNAPLLAKKLQPCPLRRTIHNSNYFNKSNPFTTFPNAIDLLSNLFRFRY